MRRRVHGPAGGRSSRNPTIDTLARLRESGAIDEAMFQAGREFENAFALAQLDPLKAASLDRTVKTRRNGEAGENGLLGRRRLHLALDALGGLDSPAGAAAWHVLGLGRSLREWALGTGWGGQPLRQEAAQGILVAALGMLAGHFRLAPRPQAAAGLDDDRHKM